LPKAAPFQPGTVVPLRGLPHRIVHRSGERGTVWTETRDSGERILCVAGAPEHIDRRIHDYLKREVRKDLHKASLAYAEVLGVKVKRLSIRDQSSRWGSCTSAGSLSFSWRLILAPPVLDYLRRAWKWRICRDEPFKRVLASSTGLRPCRARQELDTHGNDLHRYGIQERSRAVFSPGRPCEQHGRPDHATRRGPIFRTADPPTSRRVLLPLPDAEAARMYASALAGSLHLKGSARAGRGLAQQAPMAC
jgi:hypothetical protein